MNAQRWFELIDGVLFGVWLLPEASEALPAGLTLDTLWDAVWPLLAGGGLAALGAWLRRLYARNSARWVPLGILGVYIEKVLTRVLLPATAIFNPSHAHGHDESTARETGHWFSHVMSAGSVLSQLEAHLRSWPLAALLLMLLLGLLIGSLAIS